MSKPKYEKSIFAQFLHTLFVTAGVLVLLAAVVTAVFDPFYHYHKPIEALGLKAVQADKEYQVPGVLRHFDYDAVLAGSSVVENNDNSWFNAGFGCTTVKAVRSYGGVADLCWYLDQAFASHNTIRYVFFNLDPAALTAAPETTFASAGAPMYLYDNNPFNDVKYLLNKTVLLEKIPYMIAKSRAGYNENLSYNWAEGKNFSTEGALSQYWRRKEISAMKPADTYAENVQGNIRLLTALTEAHPETQFIFFLPPYSALWWDEVLRSGERDAYLRAEEQTVGALLACGNVRVFDFQNEVSVVGDLDNYMDSVHFRPEINFRMVQAMVQGTDELTKDNYRAVLSNTLVMSEQLESSLIAELEAADRFQYE